MTISQRFWDLELTERKWIWNGLALIALFSDHSTSHSPFHTHIQVSLDRLLEAVHVHAMIDRRARVGSVTSTGATYSTSRASRCDGNVQWTGRGGQAPPRQKWACDQHGQWCTLHKRKNGYLLVGEEEGKDVGETRWETRQKVQRTWPTPMLRLHRSGIWPSINPTMHNSEVWNTFLSCSVYVAAFS